jgi:putative lipase involved disintegration of autophagic bodies
MQSNGSLLDMACLLYASIYLVPYFCVHHYWSCPEDNLRCERYSDLKLRVILGNGNQTSHYFHNHSIR